MIRRQTVLTLLLIPALAWADFEPVLHNNPGLVVDLGVGLWAIPLPMDYDGDGDSDLVVGTINKPSPGLFFFENPGGDPKFPIFKPAVRIGEASDDLTISYFADRLEVLTPGRRHPDFKNLQLTAGRDVPFKPEFHIGRANQWKILDYDGDGVDDLIIGASDWREYGWDNAFDAQGNWTRGPLHGYVYFMKNTGSNESPVYAAPSQVQAGGKPVDVFGCPSPNFADWDGDGDLDLICGEFLDRLTWFENVGTRTDPVYAEGRFLERDGEVIHMELQMMQVVAYDWDRDGDQDILIGKEDGRVVMLEFTGEVRDRMPVFNLPRYFEQQADWLKCGALSTPYSVDWDSDGDEDLICGDTAGYINFIENLDGGNPPKWARPERLQAGPEIIHIQAGPNGSIQGPAEAKWGYTVLSVADWDGDGLHDIMTNSIWGKVEWYRNIGRPGAPRLESAQPIEVEWKGETPKPEWNWWNPEGKQLVTQWRTRPVMIDLYPGGLPELVMLDQEGYLVCFQQADTKGPRIVLSPKRIFNDKDGNPLRLNEKRAGRSGRRQFVLNDWDRDGDLDLILDSKNMDLWRNIGGPGEFRFTNEGNMGARLLAGHTTSPTIVNWDGDEWPDLLVGAEDGFFYYLQNPSSQK